MVRPLLVIVLMLIPSTVWASTLFDGPEELPGDKIGVVLEAGGKGAWDSDMVEAPTVVRDGDRWVMLYAGYRNGVAQIGAATSDDGEHWDKQGVVLEPRGDEAGISGPVLVQDGDRWLLYYVGLSERGYEQGEKTIRLAVADSALGPWQRRGVVVEAAGQGWRSKAVWHANVVRAEGQWFMFFNATGGDDRERIGFATAPSPAGPWTVDDRRSPVLEPVAKTWESELVGDPYLRRDGERWVMTYFGFNGWKAADAEAVTTASAFPGGWRRTGKVLEPSESYDAIAAHKPWIVERDGDLWHYYTAVGVDHAREIALVVR